MESNRQLVPVSKAELSARGELSPKDSALMNILNTTAQTLRTELTPEAVHLWKHVLAPYPIEQIRLAFLEHVKTERFFPLPAEILTLIEAEQRRKREMDADRHRRQERAQIEAARAAGQLIGIDEMRKALLEVVNRSSALPPQAAATPPGVVDSSTLQKPAQDVSQGKYYIHGHQSV